jgi:hypothetical protein
MTYKVSFDGLFYLLVNIRYRSLLTAIFLFCFTMLGQTNGQVEITITHSHVGGLTAHDHDSGLLASNHSNDQDSGLQGLDHDDDDDQDSNVPHCHHVLVSIGTLLHVRPAAVVAYVTSENDYPSTLNAQPPVEPQLDSIFRPPIA